MAKSSTFSNESLVRAWAKVHAAGGTRKDVVKEMGLGDNGYNNVTQRVKQLTKRGVVFPELNAGHRGQRTSDEEIAKLAALLAPPVEEVIAG